MKKQNVYYRELQTYITRIVAANTENELIRCCTEIAESIGVSYFSHGLMWLDDFHKPKFKIISNYRQDWLAEYDEKNYYQVDPRARQCMHSITPVYWDTEKPFLDKLAPDAREMMENAHEHQVYSGVTAAIFAYHDIKGAFTFGYTTGSGLSLSKKRQHLTLISPLLNSLGVFVHQAMIRCLKLESNPLNDALSEREKDCLSWVAEGKTMSEIASSLCLSESTIKYHLKNAMHKLDAKNTSQALSIAILKGYIQPAL